VSAEGADSSLIDEVREKTKELEGLLDTYSQRLRRMRQRNREVEQEISSFEADLDNLRAWLAERIDAERG
jgi:hypothetical protein